MKLRCLIVDDEPIARQIVEGYCALLPEVELVDSCGDALAARRILGAEPVDVIFLDIDMPVLDGLAFVRTLRQPPRIVFTTAYREFAPEAFDLGACDYLLKPFPLARFIQAVDRAQQLMGLPQAQPAAGGTAPAQDLYIRSAGKFQKIIAGDMEYAEARGNQVRIVTASGTYTATLTFSAFEAQLPKGLFLRVHRSFVINKSKIRLIEGNRLFIGAAEIPIGRNYREGFLREIGLR